MNFALCLAAGALIASANIGAWAWAVRRLGKPATPGLMALLLLLFTAKLGLSALAVAFIVRSPWFSIPGLVVGVGIPASAMIAWNLLRTERETRNER